MSAAPTTTRQDVPVHFVPLGLIDESPFHKRTRWGDMPGLAANIKETGVLEPGLARRKGERWELVFAHRRFRASKMAGALTLPLVETMMTDEQVIEAQAIENLQREDIHPIEEAETLALLVAQRVPAARIAARIGKSPAYVSQRLKLLELVPAGRKACLEGKFSASVALLVARVPGKLQTEVLKVFTRWRRGEGISVEDAWNIIEREYMMRLDQAPFDRDDATLVDGAGTCTQCPKRTGNQRELFADVKSADICTDRLCFAAKKEAHGKRRLAVLEEKGCKVLSKKESAKVYDNWGHLDYRAPFVELDAKPHEDTKNRSYRTLAKNVEDQVVVVVDKRGDVHELLPKTVAAKALRDAGVSKARANTVSTSKENAKWKEQQKKERQKAQRRRRTTLACLAAIVAAEEAEPSTSGLGWLRFVARGLLAAMHYDDGRELMKRRGMLDDPKQGHEYEKRIGALIGGKDMREPELRGLIVEMIAGRHAYGYYRTGLGKGLVDALNFYEIDPKEALAKAEKQGKGLARGDGVCRECGCDDDHACETDDGPCTWVEPDLCSACAPKAAGGAKPARKARGKRG